MISLLIGYFAQSLTSSSPRCQRLPPPVPTPIQKQPWDNRLAQQPGWLPGIWRTLLVASATTALPPLIPENVLFHLSKISELWLMYYAIQPTPSNPIAADILCSGPLQDCSIHIPLNYPGKDSTQYSGHSFSMHSGDHNCLYQS